MATAQASFKQNHTAAFTVRLQEAQTGQLSTGSRFTYTTFVSFLLKGR